MTHRHSASKARVNALMAMLLRMRRSESDASLSPFIPAKAGIHTLLLAQLPMWPSVGPRFRGDERVEISRRYRLSLVVRCDCQTADDMKACVITRIVWPAPGAPVFPQTLEHIEGDGAPRSATSRFPMPPRGSTGAHLSRQRETRAPCGAPPSQACAGWALSWAAISLPGTVLPGRGQMERPILAGSDPIGSRGLWPAFVLPRPALAGGPT